MNKTKLLYIVAIGIFSIGVLLVFLFNGDSNQNTTENPTNSTTQQSGNYQKYSKEKLAEAEDKTVVLFFKATWCPSCLALDRNIKENLSSIPDDLLILEVPYDKASGATDEELQLGEKNGVEYQHTLMVVDSEGNKVRDVISAFRLSQVLDDLKN